MNRLPTSLAVLLRARGAVVVEEPGWVARGNNFTELVGGMIHHWGSSAAARGAVKAGHSYPATDGGLRTDQRIVYNIFVDMDATVHLIAAGAATYSSCYGSRQILDEVRRGVWPGGTARERRITDQSICGNRYFWNLVGEHAGDGSPMNAAQEHAIVVTVAVLTEALGKTITQTIGHLEWTPRKIDPRWNGPGNRTPALRAAAQLILDGAPTQPIPPQEDTMMRIPDTVRYGDGGWNTSPTSDGRTDSVTAMYVGTMQAVLTVKGFIDEKSEDSGALPVDTKFGRGTEAAVKGFQTAAKLDSDGVCGPMTWTALIHGT